MFQISFKCLNFVVKYIICNVMLEMFHRKFIIIINIDCMLQKFFKVVLKNVSKGLKITSHSRLKCYDRTLLSPIVYSALLPAQI